MKTRINEYDTQHMKRFPAAKKMRVMSQIQSLTPLSSEQRTETHHYEKAMMRLREDGFDLIDMQSLETALTTVWYRERRSLPWHKHVDVKMVLWEFQPTGDTTTVMTWRI
jgi:hypothetical protein